MIHCQIPFCASDLDFQSLIYCHLPFLSILLLTKYHRNRHPIGLYFYQTQFHVRKILQRFLHYPSCCFQSILFVWIPLCSLWLLIFGYGHLKLQFHYPQYKSGYNLLYRRRMILHPTFPNSLYPTMIFE